MLRCKGVSKVVKDIVNEMKKIDAAVIEEVTQVTGAIKALEASPTFEMVRDAIPQVGKVADWLDGAIDKYSPGLTAEGGLPGKLLFILNNVNSEYAKNGILAKLAALAIAIADNFKNKESLYDRAVTTEVYELQHASKIA